MSHRSFIFQKINEKPQVIADYECGRAIPNNQVLGKIERAISECPSAPPLPMRQSQTKLEVG